MRLGVTTLFLLVAASGCVTAPPPSEPETVRVAGSDTVLVLGRRLAEVYMGGHPGVAVRVEGGGTAKGVDALLAGEVDLAAASRPLTADEVRRLFERFGTLGVTFPIAFDALSVFLNPRNPVRNLSLEQLAGIFAGEVSDWESVGGTPGAIRVLIRPPSSGTHRFFRDHVLRERDYRSDATTLARTDEIVAAVAGDPAAIGYGGVAYGAGVIHCALDGVLPPEAPGKWMEAYPLGRHLLLVAPSPPDGQTASFVDWCLSVEGQDVVDEVGYLPLWTATAHDPAAPSR